jgi:hypothetical protein
LLGSSLNGGEIEPKNADGVTNKILAGLLLGKGLAMTLIIRDQLVNPPTWFASFRDLTLYCHVFLRTEVLIESDDIDAYYRWIKPRGGMDFIEDFVSPGEEDGLHLDVSYNDPRTVVTDRIAPENFNRLIRSIQFCRSLV